MMNYIELLKKVIPNINQGTLTTLSSVGDNLVNSTDQELENLLVEHLSPLGVTTEGEVACLMFELGKELGKQEVIKNQKIFVQGDY